MMLTTLLAAVVVSVPPVGNDSQAAGNQFDC